MTERVVSKVAGLFFEKGMDDVLSTETTVSKMMSTTSRKKDSLRLVDD